MFAPPHLRAPGTKGFEPTVGTALEGRAARLHRHAETRLSRYKLPRQLVLVEQMVRSPSGKADYRWAKATAEQAGAPG